MSPYFCDIFNQRLGSHFSCNKSVYLIKRIYDSIARWYVSCASHYVHYKGIAKLAINIHITLCTLTKYHLLC